MEIEGINGKEQEPTYSQKDVARNPAGQGKAIVDEPTDKNSASFFIPKYGIVICCDVKERLVETRS